MFSVTLTAKGAGAAAAVGGVSGDGIGTMGEGDAAGAATGAHATPTASNIIAAIMPMGLTGKHIIKFM
jgi:hypothetical protein